MEIDRERRLSDLMKRAQDGDRPAYEAFLTEAAVLVRAFVRRRLRQPDQVEDVVQETFLAIHHYRHTYDPARPVCPWMYAIARHRLLDFVKKRTRREENEILNAAGTDESRFAAPQLEEDGRSDALRHALTMLSNTQRVIIRMLKWEGYSVSEISKETGLSESSVKVTAHRGYKTLRKLMGET